MKYFYIILIICISNCCYGNKQILKKINTLIPYLIIQESNNNINAVGDNGNAIGCLQIWKITIDDVNKIYKLNFKYKDRYNRYASVKICTLYLYHYGKYYKKQYNKTPSFEVLSRIWNGGPFGYKKESTKKYWNKLKKKINYVY